MLSFFDGVGALVIGLIGVVVNLIGGTSSDVFINTNYGVVQGRLRTGQRSGNFYSFQGIPYAEPPIGHLRFKDPVLPKPWTGIFDARQERFRCHGDVLFPVEANLTANEDCLTLNVFSKTLAKEKKSPVMVWIHGGSFKSGSSYELIYGPDLLLQKNVVIVTLNYRLGALGFLSNSDRQFKMPGNAALKDQSFALRWVKANIANFGGDPDNITVFGQSSGGAAVHFHLISDYSKGLFNKAIVHSGSTLLPWAIAPAGDFNQRLARKLGWSDEQGIDALMKVLKTANAEDIVRNQEVSTVAETQTGIAFAFLPVVEPYKHKNSFLSCSPSSLSKRAWSNKIPLLIGGNSAEGFAFNSLMVKRANFLTDPKVFQGILPPQLGLPIDSALSISLGESIRKFYFGNDTMNSNTLDKIATLLSDKHFWQGISGAVRARVNDADSAPTYLYRFDFNSALLTAFKLIFAGCLVPGAVHSEELMYLWSIDKINTQVSPSTPEAKVMDYMVEVWTKFAETSNPVTNSTPGWVPVVAGNAPYKTMNFNSQNTFIDLPETERIAFWDSLYEY